MTLPPNLLTLTHAAALVKELIPNWNFKNRIPEATVRYWSTRGVKHGSTTIYLKTYKIGGKVFTTKEDIEAFLTATLGETQ